VFDLCQIYERTWNQPKAGIAVTAARPLGREVKVVPMVRGIRIRGKRIKKNKD
jgi:hypothetical protein